MITKMKSCFAIIAAIIICVTGIGTISAKAASHTITSGLSYTFEVEKDASKQITVHITLTSSVALNLLTFFIYYDDKCTFASGTSSNDGTIYDMAENKAVMYSFTNTSTSGRQGTVTIDLTFKTSDSADNPHTFIIATTSCMINNQSLNLPATDMTVTTDDLYTIGDVDNNGTIDTIDAYYAQLIADRYNSPTIEKANNKIDDIHKYICATVVCAEAADANHDGYITSADNSAITYYYANKNVNASYTDDFINSQYYVTIVA